MADYEALGKARHILADYVDEALSALPHARREMAVALLKQMVTGRETKLPLPPQEIMAGVEGDLSEKETALAGLVGARLVRGLDVNGAPRYELAHDILVDKVKSWVDEIERQAHTARDFLRQGREEWARLEILPQAEKIAYLHQQRENPYLHLEEADLRLMLHAALRQGTAPDYWTRRAAGAGLDVTEPLTKALGSEWEKERIYALHACLGVPLPLALTNLGAGMVDGSPRVRVAAHQLLFALATPEALALLNNSDDLRLVPAGEFTMGSDKQSSEGPIHEVMLAAYFIEKYPVTNEKYAQFIAAGGYQTEDYWTRQGWRWRRRSGRTQPTEWENRKNRTNHPVVYVSWHEAWAYAAWAGRRLPTEAEWEKAATWRDGEKLLYPWGNEFDKACGNTSESKIGTTTPVGQFSPDGDSPYGCVDMSGNVWEWTSSLYRPYPYRADDGREEAEAGGTHVQRGGSYYQNAAAARGGYRNHDYRVNGLGSYGFRCGVVSRLFSPPPADR
jgi:formylglycine-generating enzyme required for sulfatase activity